ncbi:host cell division inhibitor Icd-like protein [Yersinia enterocolitica]|nr:host cell division inhibitor Icd-like protein [Yersinia enterocolitica]
MFFTVLLERSNSRFVFFSCIGIYQWCSVFVDGIYHLVLNQELKTAKPGSALTLAGPLTTNDRLRIEVAMLNHTQTRPKYQYRFLALHRSDRSAAPCRLSVEAFTEKEARQVLSAHFILSLAARLPVSEVRHA